MLSASSNTAVPVAPYGRFQQIPFWRLRALFRERGLYDEDVAALTGITVPTLGRRMRGRVPMVRGRDRRRLPRRGHSQGKRGGILFS